MHLFCLKQSDNIVFFIALLAVVVSLSAEFVIGVKPCQLCLISRYLFAFNVCIVAFCRYFTRFRVAIIFSVIALFLFSFYHLGVENHWWEGPAGCVARLQTLENINESIIDNSSVPSCDKVNLKLFGISSTLWSFLLAGFIFWLTSISFIVRFYIRRYNDE
ncbi:MAG: disulfide bond formation protein B [Alphaproteobacteria bacterium]|nr:disulfide bond formation protein B [Alphaproteobacteria bacterium]